MMVRKISVGSRIAKSVTKSHSPRGARSATSRRPISCACGAIRLTALGANQRLTSWRYFACSGGSIWVGTKRYAGSGSQGVIDSLEKISGCWYISRTSSCRVKTQ